MGYALLKEIKKVDIGIKDSLIKEIKELPAFKTSQVVDAKNLLVLPGAIDTQVHFREPGATDSEDLYSGSRAAIMGGITSILRCQILIHQPLVKRNF
jgi:dihydroorotase